QEFFEVFGQAGNGLWSARLPTLLPFIKALLSLFAIGGQVNELGLLQAGALRGFEFVFQVAQFVRPAALLGQTGPEPGQGSDQPGLAVGGYQFQSATLEAAAPQIG